MIARVIRRAGDKRVERGPDQRTDVVALHQEFVFRPGDDDGAPGLQPRREAFRRRGERHPIQGRHNDKHGRNEVERIVRVLEFPHGPEGSVHPADRRVPRPSAGAASMTAPARA